MYHYNDLTLNTRLLLSVLCLITAALTSGCAHYRDTGTEFKAVAHGNQSYAQQSARINTIAAAAVGSAPRLVSKADLERAAYIVAFRNAHLLAGKSTTAFVRLQHVTTSTAFDIIEIGEPLIDSKTGARIGLLARTVGQLRIIKRKNNIGVARITQSRRAIQRGDFLLPADTRIHNIRPHWPAHAVEAAIVAIQGGHTLAGEHDVVVINKGTNSGLETGHLLNIQRIERTVTDPMNNHDRLTLPPRTVGTLMLLDINKQSSVGIVLESTRAISLPDTAI